MMQHLRNTWARYHQLLAYLIVGGLTTLINVAVFILLTTYAHWSWLSANNWAWFLSVLFAFFANKTYVFSSYYTTWRHFLTELILFFGARLASLVLDNAIMWVGLTVLHAGNLLTKLADQVIIILVNYALSKWIFKPTTKKLPDES